MELCRLTIIRKIKDTREQNISPLDLNFKKFPALRQLVWLGSSPDHPLPSGIHFRRIEYLYLGNCQLDHGIPNAFRLCPFLALHHFIYDADTATDDPDLHRYLKVVLNLLQAQCLEKLHVICSPTLKWGSAILEVS